jgi:hypothetical protein
MKALAEDAASGGKGVEVVVRAVATEVATASDGIVVPPTKDTTVCFLWTLRFGASPLYRPSVLCWATHLVMYALWVVH